ncbi:MAG: CoA pyrophosphatase [Rhodobacteraceae bacterium]|nr:CoA pyrophosphatase [Paracoccaceae bacterium]
MTAPDPFQALAAALRGPGADSSDYELNPGFGPPAGRVLRPAGVLVGLVPAAGGIEVILTKRASGLKHHPGQIALPGGKVEPGDGGPVGAALREAAEEVGLPPGAAGVLGLLPPHETVTGFVVTPVVARVEPFALRAEAGEVEEAFTVPLAHVADPASYVIERRIWMGRERRYYAVPWGPYYIWGATARILRALADRLAAAA